jgi:hypothetical protein
MNAASRTPPRRRPGQKTLTPKVENLVVGDTSAADTQTAERPDSGTPRVRAGSEDLPRFQQQIRVEARLWPEQVPRLTELRRAVSRARVAKSERITDNTLLRIAVDLLLAHADRLTGDTEDQLRASVLPDTGTHEQPE